MKRIKFLLTFVLAAMVLGCSEDENSMANLQDGSNPMDIAALFTITQDNTGRVTIAPYGEGATKFKVYMGHGEEEFEEVPAGGFIEHAYPEGVYQVKVVGSNLNGKTAEYNHTLTVSYVQPENLAITVTPITGNAFGIDVTATADYETYFEVNYGEDPAQVPVQFNETQTVSHTYSGTGTYTVTVTAFSGGAATSVETTTVTIVDPLVLPIDFESTTQNYVFGDFDGAATSRIDNPHATGLNTSAKVARLIKNPGAQTWAGTVIVLDQTIDFATANHFRMKVWSPQAGRPVTLKVENLTNSTISHEAQVNTTVSQQWEVLDFDFSGANLSQQYSKIVLFFNLGTAGSGDTYFFDDISLVPGPGGVGLPLTFENSSLTYTFNNFGGAFGATVANPQQNGINTSATVGRFIKNAGSETWAGIAMPMAAPINFSVNKKIKMKVWSPAAGKVVLMKLENIPNSAVNMETQATTTVAGGWEELTFDFTGISTTNTYQMIVLFFNFNVSGTGETYYFDDLTQSN
jgi:PKD repeat protein